MCTVRRSWSRRAVAIIGGTGLSLLPLIASGQVPRGPDFPVAPGGHPEAVAADAAGNFVVTWSAYQDGSQFGVYARRFDASGTPNGPEFRVNVYTTDSQHDSAVAAAPDGSVLYVWESNALDPSQGISARFAAAGAPGGPEFRANAYTTGVQNAPAVAAGGAGNFVVVWVTGPTAVFARRFDSSGTPLAPEFVVTSSTSTALSNPAVGVAANGAFVVVWEQASPESGGDVLAQRYDAAGVAVGSAFRVNAYTTREQADPVVAMDGAGNFVVAWTSVQQVFTQDVMARRYDTSGVPIGDEFKVNRDTDGYQMYPSVASDAAGNFVVAWHRSSLHANPGVFARWYDRSGNGSDPFAVSSTGTGVQEDTFVASDPKGNFVVSWLNVAAATRGIFARQFLPGCIFADGFESGDLSAWSSSATDAGDLDVSPAAALGLTSMGLRGAVDDTAGLFVEDDTPQDEARYRVRFHFDPNGFDPGEAQNRFRTRVFLAFTEAPARRVAAVVLRRIGGAYDVMGRVRLDGGAQADTASSRSPMRHIWWSSTSCPRATPTPRTVRSSCAWTACRRPRCRTSTTAWPRWTSRVWERSASRRARTARCTGTSSSRAVSASGALTLPGAVRRRVSLQR